MTNTTTPSLSLTAKAAAELKRLLSEEKLPEGAGVRVGVRGGGCSGFSYALHFDESEAPGDQIFEQDGVRVFCDPKSLALLAGTTLDYSDGLRGRGFHFLNPNAKGTCGCGDSFSV